MLNKVIILCLLKLSICQVATANTFNISEVGSCLPQDESVSYSLVSYDNVQGLSVSDKSEVAPFPKAYIQYLAKHSKGAEWLGLIIIASNDQCRNPIPDGGSVEYEKYVPFDLAVKYEIANQKHQSRLHKKSLTENPESLTDYYVSPEAIPFLNGGQEISCSISASSAEAFKQLGIKNACEVQERQKPIWTQ